jgi:hypothetical protein
MISCVLKDAFFTEGGKDKATLTKKWSTNFWRVHLKFFGPMSLLYLFNTQTMHIMSILHNSIAVFSLTNQTKLIFLIPSIESLFVFNRFNTIGTRWKNCPKRNPIHFWSNSIRNVHSGRNNPGKYIHRYVSKICKCKKSEFKTSGTFTFRSRNLCAIYKVPENRNKCICMYAGMYGWMIVYRLKSKNKLYHF